ncbi:MAG TPA: GDSL-type esterase/lipase family protein [Rhizomicrobium sp.]
MRVRKLAGLAAYVLFVAVFVEISLQLFYYAMAGDFLFNRSAPPLYQSEPYAGYMNRPGLSYDHHTSEYEARYYTNQAGFRVAKPGLEYSVRKPANTYRIVLLGPSFAYGWGVDYDKSFAALLPRLLAERGFAQGRKIELIDAGVPSLEPAQQLNWYEHVGKKYQPDLVIQFIYGSMAVKSNPRSSMAADAKGYLIRSDLSASQRWRERAKHFATVFYGWMLWTDFDAWRNARPAAPNGAVMGAGRELVQQTKFDLDKPGIRDATLFYDRLAKTVRESGARLQIVYFPLSYVIYPDDVGRWRHLGVRNVEAQEAFDAAFVSYLNGRHIPAVDITDDLRKAAVHEKRLYYWLDIHWTPEGNLAAARAVADTLLRTAG